MNTETPVEKIRQSIVWRLTQLGVRDASGVHETMLIHNGFYCGRKYQCDAFEVVWFLEEDEIKFFSPTGDLLWAGTALSCVSDHQAAAEGSTLADDRRAA